MVYNYAGTNLEEPACAPTGRVSSTSSGVFAAVSCGEASWSRLSCCAFCSFFFILWYFSFCGTLEAFTMTGSGCALPRGDRLPLRADLNVQMAKAKAQSTAAWSGSELVCAAMQRGKTLNYVVMTMRL